MEISHGVDCEPNDRCLLLGNPFCDVIVFFQSFWPKCWPDIVEWGRDDVMAENLMLDSGFGLVLPTVGDIPSNHTAYKCKYQYEPVQ